MMRPKRILFLSCLWLFLVSLAHAQDAICVLSSGTSTSTSTDNSTAEAGATKCRPLRLLTEPEPITNVGVFCVQQSSPEWQVTYTVPPDYEILKVAFHATPNVSSIPSTGGDSFQRPDPAEFEFRERQKPPTQSVSVSVPPTSLGDLTCGGSTDKLLYMVAHATVRKKEGRVAVEVYAHEGILFQFADVNFNLSQYFSYVRLDCQCEIPTTNLTEADNFTRFDNSTLVPASNDTIVPYGENNATQAPNIFMDHSNITTAPSPANESSTADPFHDFVLPPKYPDSPVQGLAGEDLVVGVSFLVITETSASVKNLPHDEIQRVFGDFSRNLLHEMRVDPLPMVPTPEGSLVARNPHGRRNLWVQYDNSSFHVYQFLVSTQCGPDDAKSVLAGKRQEGYYAPPPAHSQCHRAYARFGVRIVDEDPTEVCQRLRNGTLLGYQRGMLQQALVQAYPGTTLQLNPGDFEYCVPLDDFVVPNHTEEPVQHWADQSDPLANLTATTSNTTPSSQEEFPWLMLLIIGTVVTVILVSVSGLWLHQRRRKYQQREPELSHAAPPEVSALMA
jgi:hypothetical protein